MPIVNVRRLWAKAGGKLHSAGMRVAGVWYASKGEYLRWGELRMLQRAGVITQLSRQVKFPLTTIGPDSRQHVIGFMVVDFVYREAVGPPELGHTQVVAEDFKGFRTELYRWKRKHLEAEHPIVFRESR